jgi:hypothetical protein
MRTTIKSVFPDRDVAVMVRPALSEADLQRLDALPDSRLRPEFKRVGADSTRHKTAARRPSKHTLLRRNVNQI